MFICPNCRSRLSRTQNELGVYWVCPECGGRAVNLAVMRKAVTPDFAYRLWNTAREGKSRVGRHCPTCNQSMREVVTSGLTGAMELDVCTRCQFVWFDPGELESAPAAQPAPRVEASKEQAQLPQAAREALAIYEVQKMGEAARDEDPFPDEPWKVLPAAFGLPVESDEQELQRWPWATWALCALIAAISILTFGNLDSVVQRFGMIPAEVWRMGGATLLTSFFLHGGWLHLMGNLYFLFVFGDNVEDYLGHAKFLLLLLLATLVGDAAHILFGGSPTLPCVGASGGISGVIVFYALKFPQARIGFISRYARHGLIQVPAWCALIVWLLLQGLGAHQQLAGFSDVSALAHLGGAAVGFLFWLGFWKE